VTDIHFPRLNITVYPTYIIANRWAFFADSCMIECSAHARLKTAVVSLYGDNGLVDVVRFNGVEWDEVEHRILTWFQARPTRMGWLLELQAMTEVAA
jgi:hypothetical protein